MLAASADEELPHVAQRGQDRCVSAQHYRSVQLDVCKSSICDGLTFWVLADTSEPGELANISNILIEYYACWNFELSDGGRIWKLLLVQLSEGDIKGECNGRSSS